MLAAAVACLAGLSAGCHAPTADVSGRGLPVDLTAPAATLPMQMLGNVPVLRAGIDGGVIRLGVMSLGRVNIVSPVAADRLGLPIERTRMVLRNVWTGRVIAQPEGVASVPAMNLGGAVVHDLKAYVCPMHEQISDAGRTADDAVPRGDPPYDALVGVGIFAQCLVDLDFGAGKLTLSHGELPEPDGADVVPLKFRSGLLMVPLRVGETTVWANVQTTSPLGLVIPGDQQSRFPGAGSAPPLFRTPAKEGAIEVRGGPLRVDVGLGRHVLHHPFAVVVGAGLDFPFVGMDFLRQMDVTLDLPNGRARFRRVGTAPVELGPPPRMPTVKPVGPRPPFQDKGTTATAGPVAGNAA